MQRCVLCRSDFLFCPCPCLATIFSSLIAWYTSHTLSSSSSPFPFLFLLSFFLPLPTGRCVIQTANCSDSGLWTISSWLTIEIEVASCLCPPLFDDYIMLPPSPSFPPISSSLHPLHHLQFSKSFSTRRSSILNRLFTREYTYIARIFLDSIANTFHLGVLLRICAVHSLGPW